MKLSNNEAAIRTGSLNAEAGAKVADEIDLYDELTAFAELPAEQRHREQAAPAEGRAEPLRTTAPIQPLASAQVNDDSREPGEIAVASPELFPAFGNSGPLGGLRSESHFKGAMTGGVCLACGAESGANDLFCITCGAFVDQVEPTPQYSPTCAQCGLGISADDIFCPQCGAVSPVS